MTIERVEVTFPVRISLDLDTACDRRALRSLASDLAATVEAACLGEDHERALWVWTPNDEDSEPFTLTVDNPTVDLPDFGYVLSRITPTPIRG